MTTYEEKKREVATEVMDVSIGALYRDQRIYRYYGPSQREFVWPRSKQQKFIDTILRNLPIPAFMLMRDTDETGKRIYEITDGQQRQETIIKFMNNGFPTMDKDQAKACMMRLPLIEPGRTYKQLSPTMRNRFDDRLLHMVTFDREDEYIIEEIFYRANEQSPFTVGERLYIRNSRAKLMAITLEKHTMWERLYTGGTRRRQIFQAAMDTIMIEMTDGGPVNLRIQGNSAPIHKLVEGEFDSELTDTCANTIWQRYTAIEHLFKGIYLQSKSDIVPVYEAVMFLEAKGVDLTQSEEGCLRDWFNTTKRGILTDRLAERPNHGRLDFLKEQQNFWALYADLLLEQKGLTLK